MTTKRCPKRKSNDRLTLLRHPVDGYVRWSCWRCIRSRYPVGALIARFIDHTRPKESEWFVHIRGEEDLAELERIGEWAQKQGKNKVSIYCYYNWKGDKNIGPTSFNFGHEHSLEYLDDRLHYFRKHLATHEVVSQRVQPETYQAILDF